MSDLVTNPKDRFSHAVSEIILMKAYTAETLENASLISLHCLPFCLNILESFSQQRGSYSQKNNFNNKLCDWEFLDL